ncbi:hypothetical protein X551_01438 [Methylibium sp. T29]|nr:hypothetical protein X551_01438 [Methylibium sp. T29]
MRSIQRRVKAVTTSVIAAPPTPAARNGSHSWETRPKCIITPVTAGMNSSIRCCSSPLVVSRKASGTRP